jgi:hypothetical protein
VPSRRIAVTIAAAARLPEPVLLTPADCFPPGEVTEAAC